MWWLGETPHYTSKRTGWPVARSAGQCQQQTLAEERLQVC
jgi:hypothetical protein